MTRKESISNLKIAFVVAQNCNGSVIAWKAGTGRLKAVEIDTMIVEYIYPSALLCTDTETNCNKFPN